MGENSFCRNSDLVVSLLPAADEYLGEHGMKKDKFHHVANGVVLEEWEHPRPLPDEHQQVFRKAHDEGKFILCFFGSHTKSYGLDILIDAVKGLDDDRVLVTFVGDGFYKQELIDRCRGAEDKFIFLPPIPKQSIPSLFNEIDAVYVAAGLSNLMRFGVCMNKLFDSMMGGKPILYAIKAPNNYVTEFNCGVSVEPESVPAVAEGIKQLLAMGEDKRNQLGSNGKEAALKYFNYTALSKRFIEIIEKED
jgi:glycosyltransferase involved in cell wall biosynthesis